MKLKITAFEERFTEGVKDLLVELQSYLSGLDESGVLVLKENFRDGYFAFLEEELKKFSGEIFVAEKDGRAIGAIVCKIFCGEGEAAYATSCPKTGFISDFVVTERERGQGVGKALLARAETYFAEKGCKFSQLEVAAFNENAAKLYQGLGYKTTCLYLSKKIN